MRRPSRHSDTNAVDQMADRPVALGGLVGLALSLRNERNPARIMDKDYTQTCDCLVEFYNLDFPRVAHCLRCHETFKTEKLWELHFHPKTGGCRFPGNIERFYENKYYPDYSVWHQRKEEEVKDNRRR